MKQTIKHTFSSLLLSSVLLIGFLPASQAIGKTKSERTETETTTEIALPADTDVLVDAAVEKMLDSRQIPGIALAVIQDGKLIKTKGYGWLDRESNVRTRPSSVFPIASMSKPLTATGIMLLVQAGKVDLDAPISTYLEETPAHWKQITLRHMLTHTAGLSERVYNSNKIGTAEGFLKQAAKAPLDFQPGESWMYSNTGYGLAAVIIENVSGQPFETFMKANIFEPLDMGETDALRASYRFSNRAMGYVASNNGHSVEPIDFRFSLLPHIMPTLFGAGSVTSTVLDMARWEIAMQKGKLLDLNTQREMQQPVVMNSGRTFHYGLGWLLGQENGHPRVSHGGNLYGYSTSIARFPNDNLTVVVLANKNNESGDALATKVAQQYVPALITDKDAPVIADPNPDLTEQLLGYLNGDTSAIPQTSEWEILLTTPRGRAGFTSSRFGTIEKLELISQEAHNNGTQFQYRAVTTKGNQLVKAIVTPDGQLAAVGIGSEE